MATEKLKVAEDFPANTNVAVTFPFGTGRGKTNNWQDGPNEGQSGVPYYSVTVEINGVQKGWYMDAPLHDALTKIGLSKGSSYYIARQPAGKTYVWILWNGQEKIEVPRVVARPPSSAAPPAPSVPATPPAAATTQTPPVTVNQTTSQANSTLAVTEQAAAFSEFLMAAEAAVVVAFDPGKIHLMSDDARMDMIRNIAVTLYLSNKSHKPQAKTLSDVTAILAVSQ